jgi:hypothetical protein
VELAICAQGKGKKNARWKKARQARTKTMAIGNVSRRRSSKGQPPKTSVQVPIGTAMIGT